MEGMINNNKNVSKDFKNNINNNKLMSNFNENNNISINLSNKRRPESKSKVSNNQYVSTEMKIFTEYNKIRELYKNIHNMKKYVKEWRCPEFNENFELLNYINSGGCGLVYEGKLRRDPNKKVALKFILNSLYLDKNKNNNKNNKDILNKNGNSTSINKKIKLYNSNSKESDFQKRVKNKNIIKLYGSYQIKDFSCIAMEFAKYGDLENFQRKLIRKKILSETFLCYITKQILNGLKFCHKAKIIHMDIKQQNILIDENLNVKLTDFSVSYSYEQFKGGEKIILPLSGTLLFLSPEIMNGTKIEVEYCNKIDMFSLGVLLYCLAYGEFPFQLQLSDRNNFKLIRQKVNNGYFNFPENKNYSILFQYFIKGLLKKNIKERFSIQEALDNPWINGADIIFKEKDKLMDLEKFLINVITDNIKPFNEYLQNYRP